MGLSPYTGQQVCLESLYVLLCQCFLDGDSWFFPPIDVVGVFGKPCYEAVLYGVMNSWPSPHTQCRGDLWPWSVNIDPELGGHIPASHRSYNN